MNPKKPAKRKYRLALSPALSLAAVFLACAGFARPGACETPAANTRLLDGSTVVLNAASYGRHHRLPRNRGLDEVYGARLTDTLVFRTFRKGITGPEWVSVTSVDATDGAGRPVEVKRLSTGAFTGPTAEQGCETWEIPRPPREGEQIVVRISLPAPEHGGFVARHSVRISLPNTRAWRNRLIRQAHAYAASDARRGDDLARVMTEGRGNLDRFRALIRQGARVEDSRKIGYTDLMWAIYKKDEATALVMLRQGRDVTARSAIPDGGTALISACEGGMVAVVKALLARGADPSLRDEYGNTAASIAARGGHRAILRLLEQHRRKARPRRNQRPVPVRA